MKTIKSKIMYVNFINNTVLINKKNCNTVINNFIF